MFNSYLIWIFYFICHISYSIFTLTLCTVDISILHLKEKEKFLIPNFRTIDISRCLFTFKCIIQLQCNASQRIERNDCISPISALWCTQTHYKDYTLYTSWYNYCTEHSQIHYKYMQLFLFCFASQNPL